MAREYQVMRALAKTEVPVPATYALCLDAQVVGAPFYVMEKVTGTTYRTAADIEPIGSERTRILSCGVIDTLAALHHIDPAAVGLADFGRPEGFLLRQVRRWEKQLAASRSRDLPGVVELGALLTASAPAESGTAIVHGDFRLDNLLIDGDVVAAVIDWELATLGDPLADAALTVAYQGMATLNTGYAVANACTAPGFLSQADMLARYGKQSGRDLSAIGFYLALAYFKLAVIAEGIYYRHTSGQTVGAGFDDIGEVVRPLIEMGLATFTEYR